MTDFLAEFFKDVETFFNQPHLLFEDWQVITRIALTSVIVYFIMVITLRWLGMRTIADFSVYDFVATLTVGSIIASTLLLSEVTLFNGLTAFFVFLGLQYLLSSATTYWPALHQWVNPSPKVVFYKGEFREEALTKARVNKEEVYAAVRRQANTTSDQVEAVILETNGSFSVVTHIGEGCEDEITDLMNDE